LGKLVPRAVEYRLGDSATRRREVLLSTDDRSPVTRIAPELCEQQGCEFDPLK